MSYSISITGHKNTGSDEESVAYERAVAGKVRAAILAVKDELGADSLSATFSGGHIGYVDLTQPDLAPAESGTET